MVTVLVLVLFITVLVVVCDAWMSWAGGTWSVFESVK